MIRISILLLVVTLLGCGRGNVCERQLIFEEEDCFPELDQPTTVEKDECVGDRKATAKCAMRNEEAYCAHYLWLNRGSARLEGYTVSDTLAPGNNYLECLEDEGLRDQ